VNLDKTVVFYEGISGMRAARGFWLLEYLGHTDAHVLDGGFQAWQAAGYPVTTEAPRVREVQFQPRLRESLHISADDLHGLLGTDTLALLDTRTDDEYLAKNVRAARGGTIPGAVHLEWVHNLKADGTFKAAAELRSMYAAAGIHPDQTVVAFCQGGYRSSHTYLALRLLGYPHLRNFIGSWKEWGDRQDLPIEVPQSL
jgi:thiosulfate/3-mercaptopyruvate sulfurtransferase